MDTKTVVYLFIYILKERTQEKLCMHKHTKAYKDTQTFIAIDKYDTCIHEKNRPNTDIHKHTKIPR